MNIMGGNTIKKTSWLCQDSPYNKLIKYLYIKFKYIYPNLGGKSMVNNSVPANFFWTDQLCKLFFRAVFYGFSEQLHKLPEKYFKV